MLTVRQRTILKSIIDIYIRTAEPVGSKLLFEQAGLGVSTATLRNEMAELISLGYLEQPHTSAGRIPTHKGYRLYVNELMHEHALTANETDELMRALSLKIRQYDRLMDQVGVVLSDLTNYASITLSPNIAAESEIHRVDIIKCEGFVYVVLFVMGAGIVKNLIVRAVPEPDAEELSAFIRALNAELAGLSPGEITPEATARLEAAAGAACAEFLPPILEFLGELARSSSRLEVSTKGGGKLLDYPEYRDIGKARELLSFLGGIHPQELFPIPGAEPIVVRIGRENLAEPLQDSTVMVAGCNLGRDCRGYIGIVGPTRMNYSRVAARLSYFARGLSAVMRDIIEKEENGG